MKFRTHLSFGILIFFIIDYLIGFDYKIISFILVVFFSVLPDIDLHSSWIGKKLKPISRSFELMLGHRCIIHSLWIVILLYFFLVKFKLELTIVGYISHLFLDMFTREGIKLFWPFVGLKGDYVSGKIVDNILFFCFFIIDLVIILNLSFNYLGI
jgi:inner membrane protein